MSGCNADPVELTPAENREFAALEESMAVLLAEEKACETISIAVQRAKGAILEKVRNRRFYRKTHKRFEDYCQERWGFNRKRASQLIALLSTAVDTDNEWQARQLIGYSAEMGQAAVDLATARGQRTGPGIRDALAELSELPDEEQASAIEDDEKQAIIGADSEPEKGPREFIALAKYNLGRAAKLVTKAEAAGEVPAEICLTVNAAIEACERYLGGGKAKRAA